MPEHPGFELRQINDRTMVRLRVRPHAAEVACKSLLLPGEPNRWRDGDPAVHWLGPDQWLLTSDKQSVGELLGHIDNALAGQLYAATDTSSGSACFTMKGPASRSILAMGCGIDMHPCAWVKGQCVRTQFANVLLLIVAVGADHFDLYTDRSLAGYLEDWIAHASEDPLTIESNTVN
jgi:sarcosine oxidase subunit gamma